MSQRSACILYARQNVVSRGAVCFGHIFFYGSSMHSYSVESKVPRLRFGRSSSTRQGLASVDTLCACANEAMRASCCVCIVLYRYESPSRKPIFRLHVGPAPRSIDVLMQLTHSRMGMHLSDGSMCLLANCFALLCDDMRICKPKRRACRCGRMKC